MNGTNLNSDNSITEDIECLGTKKVRLRRLGSSTLSPISTVDEYNGNDSNNNNNNDALLAIYMVKCKNSKCSKEVGQIPFFLRLWITYGSETFEAR